MLTQKIVNKMGAGAIARSCSAGTKNMNDLMRSAVTIFIAMAFGFFIGQSFPSLSISQLSLPSGLLPSIQVSCPRHCVEGFQNQTNLSSFVSDEVRNSSSNLAQENVSLPSSILHGTEDSCPKHEAKGNQNQTSSSSLASDEVRNSSSSRAQGNIWAPTNPRGAERLPPGIVAAESDLYPRRLSGKPSEDLTTVPRYLVTFTVGYNQRKNIDAAVKKFSGNFTIMLFHYDGRTNEWDEYEWSKRAIHVSVPKQTKWWYAKRFLHPDIVASYDYIFIWDEDLGVQHFDAEEYLKLVKKHGLEISQPALDPSSKAFTWMITKRRPGYDVHRALLDQKPGSCDPHLPPCAGFVEIMAPVFSRDAWRCVWHMIQNDLVHGWGLDFALRRCVEPAHEKIGVVDSQWVVHQRIPSLGNQGETSEGKKPWEGVRERCKMEWAMFRKRMDTAEKDYFKSRRS